MPGQPLHRRLAARLAGVLLLLAVFGVAALVAGVVVPMNRFARELAETEVRELARDVYRGDRTEFSVTAPVEDSGG